MTRSTVTFGDGVLYVDGQPYAGVRDLRVELDGPAQVDKVPLGPDSFRGTGTVPGGATEQLYEAVARAAAQFREWENAEVLRMLGEWVSGLDPAILLGPYGELLGLTVDGRHDLVVPVRERACRVCGCTELRACAGRLPCHWVGADLCSACA